MIELDRAPLSLGAGFTTAAILLAVAVGVFVVGRVTTGICTPRCVNAPAAPQNRQAITPPRPAPSTLDEVIDRVAYSLNLKLID